GCITGTDPSAAPTARPAAFALQAFFPPAQPGLRGYPTVWHALILGLILWPTDPQVPSKMPPEAWQALKEISLTLEIVGPHENWAADFNSELRYVRRHYRMLRSAPSLAECYWLPSPTVSRELCCFNEGFQAHLQMQRV